MKHKGQTSGDVAGRRMLTEREIYLINNTEHRGKAAAMIILYSGLRRGELIPLEWDDIDFLEGTITVSKSVRLAGSPYVVDAIDKTDGARRIIPIPDELCAYLKTLPRDSVYVCSDDEGGMHTASSWRAMWKDYQAALHRANGENRDLPRKVLPAWIDAINTHALRHAYCVMQYLTGVDVPVVTHMTGCSDPGITKAIYAQLDKFFGQQADATEV